jgi:hypothetical protein
MNSSIENKLMGWKNDIEEKKAAMQRAEGQKDGLINQAVEEFNCDTLPKIYKKIESLQTNDDKLNDQFEKKAKEYEEKYYGEQDD